MWLKETADHITLAVHVQPGAKRTEVVGTHGDALKIRLAAPPVDGQANEALIVFLAEQFGVPQRQVEIRSGHASRSKRVQVLHPARRPDAGW
jgi:uncharacterized protein